MEQKECINPNESLAELLQKRKRAQKALTDINCGYMPGMTFPMWHEARNKAKADLDAINAQIAIIEQEAHNGGIIRIM